MNQVDLSLNALIKRRLSGSPPWGVGGLLLLLGALIFWLAHWHPTQATSPDSAHYLRLATNWRTYDGTFPPGYSLLISLVAFVTQLPALWASKLVNWLALGVFGWRWAGRVGGERATILLVLWLLPGNLRIATYTWSETVFMVLLLEVVWELHLLEQKRSNRAWLLLALLPWVRYAGLFLFGLAPTQLRRAAPLYILFALNLFLTGYLFGGPRLFPTEPWPELARMFGLAILNEFLLYNLTPDVDWTLFWLAGVGQLSVCAGLGWLFRHRIRSIRVAEGISFIRVPIINHLFLTGIAYFLTLFILRTLSPFDPLNERLMAPGSFCWLMAGVLAVQSQHSMMSKSPERAETRTNPS